MRETIDFGFADISSADKTARVGEIFSTVAPYYNRMNDVLSVGSHRLWKRMAAWLLDARNGMSVLDIAGGSGDMSRHLLADVGETGRVVLTDINADMLKVGHQLLPTTTAIQCNGEQLPFANRSFDRVMIAFGLRNMTHRQQALSEIRRVLKTGGKYAILEFTPTAAFPRFQHWYLTTVLPLAGRFIANDEASYRYLGESILRFPTPTVLSDMLGQAGLPGARYLTFAAGAVALHHGRRRD